MPPNPSPPSNMRAWQYSTSKGGIEKNLTLNETAPVPQPKPSQHLVQIIATAINPVDYKPAEVALINRFIPKPATPCIDFAGRVVTPAADSGLKPGTLIFGMAGTTPLAGSALAQYALVERKHAVAAPAGVEAIDAATIGVGGLTAYQSLQPHVKVGDRVFINGGSGGTGVFGIQIAKALGCSVTTTCSTGNVELCKSLGADEVVDYRTQNVLEALKAGKKFDHVVENVGGDPALYWRCHEYTNPGAVYVMVAGFPSLSFLAENAKMKFWPSFLGGGKRKYMSILAQGRADELELIGKWMKEGKVKSVIDQKIAFEDAPKAFERSKTGRARGKIVVLVEEKGAGWG